MRYLLLFILAFRVWAEVSSEFLDQTKSIINWQKLDAIDWLDLKEWKDERAFKDRYPHFETLKRLDNYSESIGRILECVGYCKLFRDSGYNKIGYMSEIKEGDEVITVADSYIWIFLYDGTLVRLSPKSSITFKEINVLDDKIFYHARVNLGNVLWQSRSQNEMEVQNKRQTDVIFYPLSLYGANPLTRDRNLSLEEYLFQENEILQAPYIQANELIVKNNEFKNKKSEVFLVLPNVNIFGENLTIDTYVGIGQSNYFKVRDDSSQYLKIEEQVSAPITFKYNLRGFANTEIFEGKADSWFEIEPPARQISEIDPPREFLLNEILTRRIPSIFVAREMMLEKYSRKLLVTNDENNLAKEFGFRKWTQQELDKRLSFLFDYMRRLETSNLVIASRYRKQVLEKYKQSEDEVIKTDYYTLAYEKYIREGEISRENFYIPKLNSQKKELWKRRLGIRTKEVTQKNLFEDYYEEIKVGTGFGEP